MELALAVRTRASQIVSCLEHDEHFDQEDDHKHSRGQVALLLVLAAHEHRQNDAQQHGEKVRRNDEETHHRRLSHWEGYLARELVLCAADRNEEDSHDEAADARYYQVARGNQQRLDRGGYGHA